MELTPDINNADDTRLVIAPHNVKQLYNSFTTKQCLHLKTANC